MSQRMVLFIAMSLSLLAAIGAAVRFYWRGDILPALFWLIVTLLVGPFGRRTLGL